MPKAGRRVRSEAPIGDVLPWRYIGNRLHPTQKSVAILSPLIGALGPAGGVVLDSFAGSGSSLVAAAQMGRAFLGIELDYRHHWTACRVMGLNPRVRP